MARRNKRRKPRSQRAVSPPDFLDDYFAEMGERFIPWAISFPKGDCASRGWFITYLGLVKGDLINGTFLPAKWEEDAP